MDRLTLAQMALVAEGKAPSGTNQGVAVVLALDPKDAKALALKGGLPAKDLHCTLAFLGSSDDLDDETRKAVKKALVNWAQGKAPIPALVGGIGRFPGPKDEGDPVFAPVDAPRLPLERPSLLHGLRDAGATVAQNHGFTPHITLSYVPAGDDLPVQRLKPRTIAFKAIELWDGDDRYRVPLEADYDTPEKALRDAPTVETAMKSALLAEMYRVAASPTRATVFEIALLETDATPPAGHEGQKMVFGVWRKVSGLTHADHLDQGKKHGELHDKHLMKALHHAHHMIQAQKAKKYDEAETHGQAARQHHAVSLIHGALAKKHLAQGQDSSKTPEDVPEPTERSWQNAVKASSDEHQFFHKNHPEAFMTDTGQQRASQRSGVPRT